MKKYLLIVVASLISVNAAKAQEQLTENQKAVQSTVIKLFDALSNRDTIALKSVCTSDIILFENGQVWNIDTLLQGARMFRPKDYKRINTINFINTKVEKEIAWTTYNNQADITQFGKLFSIKWMETIILVKEEKTWKVKVLHSTLIKRS